jgi:hypothetical protein
MMAEVRAGVVYALFAKLRYGRLKTGGESSRHVPKTSRRAAKPGSRPTKPSIRIRLGSERTELSSSQSVLHQQFLQETKLDRNNALHKVSHERYLMESDLPTLESFCTWIRATRHSGCRDRSP